MSFLGRCKEEGPAWASQDRLLSESAHFALSGLCWSDLKPTGSCCHHQSPCAPSPRLKLSPSPSSRVTISRATSSSGSSVSMMGRSGRSKRRRLETEEPPGTGSSGISSGGSSSSGSSFHLAQQASASGSVSIEEVDLEGKFVQLKNSSDKVRSLAAGVEGSPFGSGLCFRPFPFAGPVSGELEDQEAGPRRGGDCLQVYTQVCASGWPDCHGRWLWKGRWTE